MIVRDLSLADPKGRFLTSPELRIDWGPFAFLSNHVDVRSATAQRINVLRLPEFQPVPDTGEPLLPDIDIDVDIGKQRSEEHTSELQSLMRISYAVFCLKKQTYVLHNLTDNSYAHVSYRHKKPTAS